MIVLVTGGRNFTDRDLLFDVMDAHHRSAPITTIIEGGQRRWSRGVVIGGADYWANRWAVAQRINVVTVEAHWNDLTQPGAVIKTGTRGKEYDAMAGPRRNAQMLAMKPDKIISFKGGEGTADCLRQARGAGYEPIEVQS